MVATDRVWHDLHDQLFGFIRSRVGNESDAEDILQDVFVRIHSRIDTLQDEDRLESWVWQIVRNAVVDHHRRRRPTGALPEHLAAPSAVGDEEPGDAARALVPCVKAAIDGLPEPYREALLLTEYGGLTQHALAERAGLSLSGAKSRVQRARGQLKQVLLDCCRVELDRRGAILDHHPRGERCPDGCGTGCGSERTAVPVRPFPEVGVSPDAAANGR